MTVTSSSAQSGTVGGEVGDRVLVAACRDGDQDAFAELVHRYHDSLCRQARRRLANVVDVDDAVQETFLRAYRSFHRVELADDAPLGPWLARILANVCTDQAARERRQAELAERAGPLDPQVTAPVEVDPPTALALQRGLRALPAPQRQAFLLRAVADLSYREIAERLGTTEENARARVVRARAALRQDLARQGLPAALPLGALVLLRQGGHRLARGLLRVLGALRPGGRGARLAEAHAAQAQQALGAAGPAATSLLAQGSSGAATSLLAQGAQLCTQVCLQAASSPVVQGAVALASAGTGRGTLVAGLAATLATAGALALPATTAHAAPPSAPSVVSALRASLPSPATSSSAASNASSTSVGASGTGQGSPASSTAGSSASTNSDPSVSGQDITAGGTSGAPTSSAPGSVAAASGPVVAPASPSAPAVPQWAEQAAAIAVAPRPIASTDSPTSPSTASTTSRTESAGAAPANGATDQGPSSADTPAPAGSSTGNQQAVGTPSTSSTSKPVDPAPTPLLSFPAECSTLPGTTGATSLAPPPLSLSELAGVASGGPFDVSGTPDQPSLHEVVDVVSAGTQWRASPIQLSLGACLGTQSGVLMATATAADGAQYVFAGGLVAAQPPAASSTGTTTLGQDTTGNATSTGQTTTAWDFLFRGSLIALPGTSDPAFGQATQFVALVEVSQPADTVSFDIVLLQPPQLTATTNAANPSPASSGPSSPSTPSGSVATSESDASDSTAGAAGDSSSTDEDTSSTTTETTTSTTLGNPSSSSSATEDGTSTSSSGSAETPTPSTSTGG
ncbi:sigma-70 family RNA polymerase sigma factor [Aciditerrimonas ferrireducens]|uniref:Sigma-70 family RNA polymerase sigma factor n=1 Tax=Aciditerrimonas ferrireducens TaxID=667306 RepID=A0ABV6C4P3_9ACTN